jgi:hypothetical protein
MKLIFAITSLFLFSCNTTKFVKNPPFKIIDATYQNWYGGREGVKGISVKILLKNIDKDITFDTIYFKKHALRTLITEVENAKLLSANINTGYKPEKIQMHANPKKEYGNSLPDSKKDTPFNLKENETVISFTKSNKTRFYKLQLKKEKDLYLP